MRYRLYGTVGYWLVEGKSMLDAFYTTVVALSTLGVEAGPPPDSGRKVFTVSVILFGVVAPWNVPLAAARSGV